MTKEIDYDQLAKEIDFLMKQYNEEVNKLPDNVVSLATYKLERNPNKPFNSKITGLLNKTRQEHNDRIKQMMKEGKA